VQAWGHCELNSKQSHCSTLTKGHPAFKPPCTAGKLHQYNASKLSIPLEQRIQRSELQTGTFN